MQWLILVENQDKAQALRRLVPSATVVSTKGNPWDIEIELTQDSLSYAISIKEKFSDIIKNIEKLSLDCEKVLLAFDPNNIGEGCAREFEKLLGKDRCVRWVPKKLTKDCLKKALNKFEQHSNYIPRCSQTIAGCHWSQAITDIVWTNKVSDYLSQELETSIKMTRLMSAIIKSIGDQERKIEDYRQRNIRHWEVEIELRRPNGEGETLDAKVIVPTLSQIDSSGGKITREIWKRKLRESKESSIAGLELPQPEPGKPWRFPSHHTAITLKNHIKKFPYFIVESIAESLKPLPIRPPLNYHGVLELTNKHKETSRKDVDECLNWLYYQGLITYPRTPSSNFSSSTVAELHNMGQKLGLQMEKEPRDFLSGEEANNRWEALRPTKWDMDPKDLQYCDGWRANKNKELTQWIYQQIVERALESQCFQKHKEEKKHFLSGPLFLTRREASEKEGKKFTLNREQELQAHMTVLLSSWEEWGDLPEGYVLEAVEVYIRERKVQLTPDVSLAQTIEKLSGEGIGRIETLEHLGRMMEEQGLIELKGRTRLTKKGWRVLEEMERSMGEYIDLNYHRCLVEIFRKIEEGSKDPNIFLNEWWLNFRTILNARTAKGANSRPQYDLKSHSNIYGENGSPEDLESTKGNNSRYMKKSA
jgi:DNA topoisomerase IA